MLSPSMVIWFNMQIVLKKAYPKDNQTTTADKTCVTTMPKVLIIGRKQAIAKAINADLKALKDR